MERKKLMLVVFVAILVIVGIYFAAFYQICEATTPPKMGQYDPNLQARYDILVECNTLLGRFLTYFS